MAQPFLNHRQTDAGFEEVTGRGATPQMNRMNLFTFDARHLKGRLGQVLAADVENPRARQASTPLIDKQEVPVKSQNNPPLRFQIGAQEGRSAVK
jgi:Putative transposase